MNELMDLLIKIKANQEQNTSQAGDSCQKNIHLIQNWKCLLS